MNTKNHECPSNKDTRVVIGDAGEVKDPEDLIEGVDKVKNMIQLFSSTKNQRRKSEMSPYTNPKKEFSINVSIMNESEEGQSKRTGNNFTGKDIKEQPKGMRLGDSAKEQIEPNIFSDEKQVRDSLGMNFEEVELSYRGN